jgi:hypothetical protein
MTKRIMTGGCQCGRVRYQVQVGKDEAYLCHCRMCQRATGGVSIAFVNVVRSAMIWDTEPAWYQSSPIARRPFCATCGTPLGFAFLDSENMDLTVGSFDDPGYFRPHHHFGVETMHMAWLDTSTLPRMRAEDHQPLTSRWIAATGEFPR